MKLQDTALFNCLDTEDIEEITPYIGHLSCGKKETVFSEGDRSQWLFIVEKGKVKITKLSQDGKEVILEIISPGEFFGAFAVLKDIPYPANAVSMEQSDLIRISRKNLLRIIDRFPTIMYFMSMNLAERVRDSHETLKNIALEKVEARIASLIVKLADKTGIETADGILIDIKLTKQDIAEMVGTTVETSIRTISNFKKNGIMNDKNGKILILDKEALELLSA